MFTLRSSSTHRSAQQTSRLRATVEVLDSRRLMAAGITATPFALTGNAESSLGGPFGLGPQLLTLDNNGEAIPSDVSATVDWGDGTTVNSASFVSLRNADNQIDKLMVYGSRHSYAQAGSYNVTIAFTGLNDPTATYQTTATIGAALPDQPVTVTRQNVVGTAGVPLNSTPNFDPYAAPVPLLTLSGTSKTLPIDGLTATIDWGDGSAPNDATLRPSRGYEEDITSQAVSGPQHTYAKSGTYAITVRFTGLPNTGVIYQTTATIAPSDLSAEPIPVTGTAGSPIDATGIYYGPMLLPGQSPNDAALQIPLLNLNGTAASIPSSGVTAIINWGDGSATSTASILTTSHYADGIINILDDSGNSRGLVVTGPRHVYAQAGNYTITIAFSGLTDPSASFQTSATITPAIIGQLNPLSDSGYSALDGITNVTTPKFVGAAKPGATVVLYATSAANPNFTIPVGIGVTDAAGSWNIGTVPFLDGSYTIVATTTNQSGIMASYTLQPLVIDATGPKILSAQVTDARTGTFTVSFSDPYGLATAPLTNASNYVVTRTTPRPRRGQTFTVTNLTASPGSTPSSPVLVTGQLATGKTPLSRNGTYLFTIRSAEIQSLAGTALNGSFDGQFPTGGGSAGSDFQVRVQIRNGKQVKLAAVHPVRATTPPVQASATARNRSVKG